MAFNKVITISLFFIILLLSTCTSRIIPAEKTQTEKKQFQEMELTEKELWQKEWGKIVQSARREGKVVVYSSIGGQTRDALVKVFTDSLGFKVEMISGKAGEMTHKLITEKKAGIQIADIYLGGSSPILIDLKPQDILEYLPSALILPEVKDGKYWRRGEPYWTDKDKNTVTMWSYVEGHVNVNSNLVNEKELSSAKELLNPKWKGKIIMGDPTMAGKTSTWFLVSIKNMGIDFMKDFVKQEPTIIRDDRMLTEWVARGKYPISIGADMDVVSEFIRIGTPLKIITLPEIAWLSGGSGTIALIKTAPHPSAAKVFINWLLSREGQLTASKAQGVPSARIDIPIDFVIPEKIPNPKLDYFEVSHEKNLELRVEGRKLANEIFSPLLK